MVVQNYYYHGIYLLFYIHILGEELALQDFSYSALQLIERNISGERQKQAGSKEDKTLINNRLHFRDELKKLIYDMVHLNLSFNSASSGGRSDYMDFMNQVKEVYAIASLKEELQDNIRDLGEIVEQIEQERESEHDRAFNRNIAIFGSITIPFGIFSGLMGMNNFAFNPQKDNPLPLIPNWFQLDFGQVLLISGFISLLSFLLINHDYKKRFNRKR